MILKNTVFKEGRVNERNLIHVTFDVTDVYVCLCCLKDNQNDHNPGTPGEGDGQFGNLLPFSQDNVSAKLSVNFRVKILVDYQLRYLNRGSVI